MKLYYFPIAPNPTKVRLYVAEKRAAGASLPLEEVVVNLIEGEQKRPEHLARNPFGNLPVLELEDGTFLRESLCIIEYLEELAPDPPLIGASAVERARTRAIERTADLGVLAPVARILHATNSPLGLPPNPPVAEFFEAALPANLGYLDALLADGRPFLAGGAPTIADCTLAAALQFARFGNVAIDSAWEHVARWDRSYRERPPALAVLTA